MKFHQIPLREAPLATLRGALRRMRIDHSITRCTGHIVHCADVRRVVKVLPIKILSAEICACSYKRSCLRPVETVKFWINCDGVRHKRVLFRNTTTNHQDVVPRTGEPGIRGFARDAVRPGRYENIVGNHRVPAEAGKIYFSWEGA